MVPAMCGTLVRDAQVLFRQLGVGHGQELRFDGLLGGTSRKPKMDGLEAGGAEEFPPAVGNEAANRMVQETIPEETSLMRSALKVSKVAQALAAIAFWARAGR